MSKWQSLFKMSAELKELYKNKLIDGKKHAASIRSEIKRNIETSNIKPTLAIVQVGNRPDSSLYVRMKKKSAAESGIKAVHHLLSDSVSQESLLTLIDSLNNNNKVNGIIVQLPLPKHLNEDEITERVITSKDVDGFGPDNIGELHRRNGVPLFEPCTPKGIITLLDRENVQIKGANALVIGRSDIVGGPVAALLQKRDATVTIAHSKTDHATLVNFIRNADIIVVAVGVANFLSEELWKEADNTRNPVIIDVGTNYIPDETKKSGSRCVGDVDFNNVIPNVSKVTPVPGGVGPMTVACLLQNTWIAAKRAASKYDTGLKTLSPVPSDHEISRQAIPTEITQIASMAKVPRARIIPYGSTKAKIDISYLKKINKPPVKRGKYIVVTGITPTPLGEGKSTTTIGLAQALGAHCNQLAIATVRQPSMGPTFGVKGGAAGGGYAQVIPMEDFNLHMTGDIHAVAMANNLLAAAIDTRIFHESTQTDAALFKRLLKTDNNGKKILDPVLSRRLAKFNIQKTNPDDLTPEEITKLVRLDIDPNSITWKRVVDINDRFLRKITIGQNATEKGLTRETGFDIAVASECMAILALATSLDDLRERLSKIVIGSSKDGSPITCDDIGCAGAMTALLKDTINPNMMQTLEKTPVLVHAGPFANISIGASSVLADKLALDLTSVKEGEDSNSKPGYVITEAGFDFTMGGERFLNIKAKTSNIIPDVVVIVATVRALKVHGGGAPIKPGASLPKEYKEENLEILEKGCSNLVKHIQNAKSFNLPVVVAVNRFSTDTDTELELVKKISVEAGASDAIIANHWEQGGEGAVDLARGIMEVCENESNQNFKFTYDLNSSIEEKIDTIATKMYNAKDVEFSDLAKEKLQLYKSQGYDKLPICIAKTQYSLSHDPNLKGVPSGYTLPIRDIKAAAGGGYLFALAGDIMTIPGLPTRPGYMNIEVVDGEIEGMF